MTFPGADLRTAVRQTYRQPVFTITVVLSLSLALAANTVIFGLVNQILMRPLPGIRSDRLVRVGAVERGSGPLVVSYAEFDDVRESVPAFEAVVAHRFNQVAASIGDYPREVGIEIVSANYFDGLGARLALGRGFLAAEAPPAEPRVVVLSDRLWHARLHADTRAVGRTIRISGQDYTIVGVAAADFMGTFPGFAVDLWVPLAVHDSVLPRRGSIEQRQDRMFNLTARLAAGTTVAQARSQLDTLAARLAGDHPSLNTDRGFAVSPATGVHPLIAGLARVFLSLLSGIVALLLLAACANVANLVLARAISRRGEIATRRALGASRGRIVGLLVTESILLGLLASGVGLTLTVWGNGLISSLTLPVGVPLALDLHVEWPVVAYAVFLGTIAGLAAGLLPALRSSRDDILPALRGSTVAGDRRPWLRNALIVAQIAVCCVLLVGATLLARTIAASAGFEVGFAADGVVVAHGDPAALGLAETEVRETWTRLRDRLGGLRQIEVASTALFVPLGSRSDAMSVRDAEAAATTARATQYNLVGTGYFDLMRIPVRAGRAFRATDSGASTEVAVVNEHLAASLWPDRSALGQTLVVGDRAGREHVVEVVGVAADSVYRRLGEDPMPFVYLAEVQWYRPDMVLFARTRPGAEALAAIRGIVVAIAPDVPFEIQPLSNAMAFSLIVPQVLGGVLGFAAIVALLLAAAGLFGVVAYLTERRTQEFGIRMALGADRQRILRSVLAGGMRITAAGLALGLVLALAASRLVARFLYGVTAGDPATFAGVSIFLLVVALAASWLPARRATATEPATALRQE